MNIQNMLINLDMTKVSVTIKKEQDLTALENVLNQMGLKFDVEEDDDWGDLSEAEIEGIEAGIADAEAGRMHSHEYVMALINETLNQLRAKNG